MNTFASSIVPAGAAAALLISGSAYGAPLATESFDYDAGTALQSVPGGGGTGFAADWFKFSGGDHLITASSVSQTAASVEPTGNAVAVTDPGFTRYGRTLATPAGADGSTLWVSVLFDPITVTGGGFGGLVISGSADGVVLGDAGGSNTNYVAEKLFGGGFANSGVAITPGDETFLVARIDFNSDPGGLDTVSLFVNPGTTQPGASTSTVDLNFGTLDQIGLISGDGTTFNLDEIRLGSSYADVAAIPEPASVALLGAGLALVVGRRRRSA